jgi:hypothetical protein
MNLADRQKLPRYLTEVTKQYWDMCDAFPLVCAEKNYQFMTDINLSI